MATRKIPSLDRYNERYGGGGMIRKEHLRDEIELINKGVNCDVGDDVDGEDDNSNYCEEEQDNSDYHGDQSRSQVYFTENGDNASLSELECEDAPLKLPLDTWRWELVWATPLPRKFGDWEI